MMHNTDGTTMPQNTSQAQNDNSSSVGTQASGLRVDPYFCPVGVDPFDTVDWVPRTAQIKDESGGVLFEQADCMVPSSWSALATNVVVSKYFFGEPDTPERETSVRQVIYRVARTITDWGIQDGYFASHEDGENFYRELAWLCTHQHGSFNSPVWFNVGLFHQYGVKGSQGNYRFDTQARVVARPETPYEYPQASACFIQSVDDSMDGIMRLATSEAMLFKFGSGTGTDLSTIRSSREKLSGGGTPSGPLSFMRVYDQIAAVVKSGGKTRRAAKMQSIKDWHPDVMDFIQCKTKEEKKAHTLIASGEYDSNFNGEAYSSIMFQNANLSVRLSDEFMDAVENDDDWTTRWVTDPTQEGPTYKAREILHEMAKGTWQCGDPGVQFDTTINKWHTCKNTGPINASNPCSEYMFLDDTACNLSSINLKKMMRPDGSFDVERFRRACSIFITAQEILVDHASYPTPAIAENSHMFRPLGLGFANLGSMLMSMGIPYDSDAGRGIAGALTALLNGEGYRTSAEIAGNIGPFAGYRENEQPMLDVMQMHRDAVEDITPACPSYLRDAARQTWNECLQLGRRHGYRNAQATVLAPTGTIAFMMDCDTTGIEPDIALIKYKQLAGGGMMKIVNQTVPYSLQVLGYDEPEIKGILEYLEEHETIEGAPGLKDEHLPVYDCAFKPANGTRSIHWKGHVGMMAAAQPFLSGAISKTVNMPADSTVEDIELAYIEGWKSGLKALAIYRDGSKQSQPLATKKEGDRKAATDAGEAPKRRRLPDTRHSLTHKFNVGGHEGYITVGLFEDGKPGELFIVMAKEGSTIGGLMDVIGTETSLALQFGVPLEAMVNKFSHARFEPSGWTTNPDIPVAKSVVDYIFRWLGITFLEGYREANTPNRIEGSKDESGTGNPPKPSLQDEAEGEAQDAASNAVNRVLERTSSNGSSNGSNGHASNGNGHHANGSPILQLDASALNAERSTNRDEQFAHFQSDAPACDACGSITVRNGNCYLCHNCGQSMGCS
ncbi:Vitamin B12-dependent ribonucleotide reductase [Thalassoglobus polymorphus]|uniref:Vitamin B12-dependent ribonucleotide reductase n=2 Tax=Thalassoglobus polymorphus TaxID=2527994 RepID=A0A517QIL5_9PLAN|nr:vitamin B12-dependent ribonucleotide reductase [Thalassoglobus polymorphus]QDT31489.1 Vitamin B12-dependent ribonucleotide reductase [Thalassoglobus polymorphus]